MVLQVGIFKDLEASIGNANHLRKSANSHYSCIFSTCKFFNQVSQMLGVLVNGRQEYGLKILLPKANPASQTTPFLTDLLEANTGKPCSCFQSGQKQPESSSSRMFFLFVAIWMEKDIGLIVPGLIPSPLGEVVDYLPIWVELSVMLGIFITVITWVVRAALIIEENDSGIEKSNKDYPNQREI